MEVLRGSPIAADVNYGRLDVNGRLVPRWHTAFPSHSFFYAALRACRTRAAAPCYRRSAPFARLAPAKIAFPSSDSVARPRLNALSPESRGFPREIHSAFVFPLFFSFFLSLSLIFLLAIKGIDEKLMDFFLILFLRNLWKLLFFFFYERAERIFGILFMQIRIFVHPLKLKKSDEIRDR